MATFNEFKNNTEILRKQLQKMNTVTESEIRPQWIEENFLKENNPHIFLQLLHYVLIDFSPFVIFVKVLDYYPTIKDDNDKKFVSNVMSLGRKMFEVDVKIDIEQFLSPKFVEKKTEWMAQFCKSVYEMHLKENKNGQETKNFASSNLTKKYNEPTNLKEIPKKSTNFVANDDDSEDEAPRNLNVLPSNSRKPVIEKPLKNTLQQKEKDSSSDEDMKELLAKRNQLNKMKEKPTIYGQKIEKTKNQENISKNLQEKMADFVPSTKINYQEQENQEPLKSQEDDSTKEYITREEFMEIMGGVSKNFNEILNKFNEFQQQVGGWVENINAKISIIEENVKTIKNNL